MTLSISQSSLKAAVSAFQTQTAPVAAARSATAGRIPDNVVKGLTEATPLLGSAGLALIMSGHNSMASAMQSGGMCGQLRKLTQVDQLERAEKLVQDAMGLVGGRTPTPFELIRANLEMAQAAAIRQSVAGQVPPALQQQIREANDLEQHAFKNVQSEDPVVVSEGARELKLGGQKSVKVEKQILNG